MTEKKTFKNAYIHNEIHGDYHEGDMSWRIFQSEGFGETTGKFDSSEWDMEVTFTKKAPQIPVGARVRPKYSTAYTYTVLAQWKDTVVVVDVNDDEIELFDADDLVIV